MGAVTGVLKVRRGRHGVRCSGAKALRIAMCPGSAGSAPLPTALVLARERPGDAAQKIAAGAWRLDEGDGGCANQGDHSEHGDAGSRRCGHRDKQGQTARDERAGQNDGASHEEDNPEQDQRDVGTAAKISRQISRTV